MWKRWACIAVLLIVRYALGQEPADLNVDLMESTFMLEGRIPNGITRGTGFILMRPLPGTQPNATTVAGKLVLITAAHVLEDMTGDAATIYLRVHDPATDTWSERAGRFKIRHSDHTPLWKKHPNADIAVMYVSVPFSPFERVIPTTLLADDDTLKRYTMAPGTELNCLGYPLGDKGPAGFPILRTGVIASFPLVPTRTMKRFLFDFRVFKGNSGGPVYFRQQSFRGNVGFGPGAQFILGLVTDEDIYTTPAGQKEPYEGIKVQQLSIGWVVYASLIADTINLLPSPEKPESKALVVPILLNSPAMMQ